MKSPALVCLFACMAIAFSQSTLSAAGAHNGEEAKLEVTVQFHDYSGWTTTNASGTTYAVDWWSLTEDKIYPSAYWGTFPLYFLGADMRYTVTLKNTAAKGGKSFKIRVEGSHRVLHTDGSAGMRLSDDQAFVIESLKPGECKVIDSSIHLAPLDGLESGLDITKIRVLHLNSGANADAALIKEACAVWCPPSEEQAAPYLNN